jgi:hypothetical protein
MAGKWYTAVSEQPTRLDGASSAHLVIRADTDGRAWMKEFTTAGTHARGGGPAYDEGAYKIRIRRRQVFGVGATVVTPQAHDPSSPVSIHGAHRYDGSDQPIFNETLLTNAARRDELWSFYMEEGKEFVLPIGSAAGLGIELIDATTAFDIQGRITWFE